MNRLIVFFAGAFLAWPAVVSAQEVDSLRVAGGDTTGVQSADSVAVEEKEPEGPQVRFEMYLDDERRRATLLGLVTLVLNESEAPEHTNNFLKLVRDGFYEGVAFHRIVPAFLIQGGDPKSRVNWQSPDLGTGGPGYALPGEFGLPHVRGALAASRLSDTVNEERESNGSQFYICLSDLPSLDSVGYSVFGMILEGMDVIDRVAQVKNAGSPNQNRALSRVYMKNVTVLEP